MKITIKNKNKNYFKLFVFSHKMNKLKDMKIFVDLRRDLPFLFTTTPC